ncbi:hypothetical protein IFR05_011482 [Cadophora sp. M221]|nr:hypothetical protein IFR05_011482 [Cadophora sp. M221]
MAQVLFTTLATFFILVGLSCPAHTQAVGSFYFGRGSAVVVHEPGADNFLYSINSAKGFGDLQPIEVEAKPKNGTAIACTGYSGPTSVYGQVFYQSVNSSLAFLFFKCSYASGICVNYGEHIISSNIATPVSPNTKIAAALFSKDIGYRVTYQDIRGSIRQLAYANNTQGVVTNWADGNLTGDLTVPDGYPISTTYLSPSNTTRIREIVYAAGLSTPTLPSFVPSLAYLATLTYNSWDCIFYIDSTSRLQFMRSTDSGTTWSLQPQMDLSSWPLADTPNAPLAASSSFNISDGSAYIYYQSGGKIIQARIRNALWETAQAVQAPPNGTFISPNNVPSPDTPKDENKSADGATLKIRIGAGIGVGVAALLVLATLGCHFRRARIAARRARAHEIEKPDSIFGGGDDVSSECGFGFTGKAELSGRPTERVELDHDPDCRLLHQLQAARLGELGGVVPWELEGGVQRGELDAGLVLCTCACGEGLEPHPTITNQDDEIFMLRSLMFVVIIECSYYPI